MTEILPPSAAPPREAVSWIEVNFGAIRHNYRLMRAAVTRGTRFFAVVKADGYGHGAVPVSRVLLDEGADMLCIARVEEAVELRNAGITAPLLILAPPFAAQAEAAVRLDAAIVVCTLEQAQAIDGAAGALGRTGRVHLKTDVGMGRLGCRAEDALSLLRQVRALPGVRVEGIMTHFPSADGKSDPSCDQLTRDEIATFDALRREVMAQGLGEGITFHAANSAATLDYPASHFDAVRSGIALYGQQPSFDTLNRPALAPAMAVKTRIVFLKEVPEGTGLSYGHTFRTSRTTRVATIPMGYADGYPRHASNRTRMLVHGQPAPVLGRVCMDHTLIDVTDISAPETGDEVLVFGRDGSAWLPVEEVAAALGSIGYELTTRIGKRLPRVHV